MKIICIGRNYAAHAAELNNPIPETPLLFLKPDTAVLKDGKAFYHPNFSNDIHHEIEVVLRICKNGKSIEPEFAHKYYDQATLGIDFTARDLQSKCKEQGHPWEIAKAFDNSAVLGEMMLLAELRNADGQVDFSLSKNGVQVQHGNTSQMLSNFDAIISYASKFFTLQVGDLIFTGTPAGVSQVKIGDVLEGFVGDKKLLYCEVK
jgi:2-keto-4-pentenoate hydratase/2-oxohepta-3-ene-1,7-dioic acid hydratase in catechol pathway